MQRLYECSKCCSAYRMLKMLQTFKNVTNVAEPSKCCKCCRAFKMLQMLQRPLNVANVAVLSKCCKCYRALENGETL